MSELRARMIRDMTVRGFSPRTHEAYIRQVVGLARYYRRTPDQLSPDEVQAYLAYMLQEGKVSWSTCAQAAHAFRFLYHVTLGRDRVQFQVPAPRQPQKLPEILSREEVGRLLNACTRSRDRLLLATTYAAGLRVSEHPAARAEPPGPKSSPARLPLAVSGGKLHAAPLRPRPRHLGGTLGITAVLHTWGQTFGQHLHIHCLVTGGALAADGTRWRPARSGFLFPVRALTKVVRGLYLAGLQRAFARGALPLTGGLAPLAEPTACVAWLTDLRQHAWVVYGKPPFAGPPTCSPTSAATPTASPSPTTAWSPSPALTSAFAGETTPMAIA